MPKRNNFIEGLRRKQQRAAEAERAGPPAKKAPSEMSDAELERELARVSDERRVLAQRAVEAGRQELVGGGVGFGHAIFARKRRPLWK